MSAVEPLADKTTLAEFLETDTLLHIYEIGDLDPFFWPHTRWFGQRDASSRVAAIALIYSGMEPPTLLAFERRNIAAAETLVAGLSPHLPSRFYAHLSPNLTGRVGEHWRRASHGRFLKMALTDRTLLEAAPIAGQRIGPENLAEVVAFYSHSYPGNWFDPRMLETGATSVSGATASSCAPRGSTCTRRTTAWPPSATSRPIPRCVVRVWRNGPRRSSAARCSPPSTPSDSTSRPTIPRPSPVIASSVSRWRRSMRRRCLTRNVASPLCSQTWGGPTAREPCSPKIWPTG